MDIEIAASHLESRGCASAGRWSGPASRAFLSAPCRIEQGSQHQPCRTTTGGWEHGVGLEEAGHDLADLPSRVSREARISHMADLYQAAFWHLRDQQRRPSDVALGRAHRVCRRRARGAALVLASWDMADRNPLGRRRGSFASCVAGQRTIGVLVAALVIPRGSVRKVFGGWAPRVA